MMRTEIENRDLGTINQMSREFFKTSIVHTCLLYRTKQEMGRLWNEEIGGVKVSSKFKGQECKCRKFVGHRKATEMVEKGEAEWMIDYSADPPAPTWNLIAVERKKKTPRANTIEKAHIERFVERQSDLEDKRWMGQEIPEDILEDLEQPDIYYSIQLDERCKIFYMIGGGLQELKNFSDKQGDLTGVAGKVLTDKLITEANRLKETHIIDDPFMGEAIFNSMTADHRTKGGIGKNVNKKS